MGRIAKNAPLMQNMHPNLHPEGLWRMMKPMDDDDCAHKNIPFTNKMTNEMGSTDLDWSMFFPHKLW